MGSRILAYGFLMGAEMAVAALALTILGGPKQFSDILGGPYDGLIIISIPGLVVLLAAALVHRPYIRALTGDTPSQAYKEALVVVSITHFVYLWGTLIVAIVLSLVAIEADLSEPVRDTASLSPLGMAMVGIIYGPPVVFAFSVIFGFIPNLLIAAGFTRFMLWRRQQAAPTHSHMQGDTPC